MKKILIVEDNKLSRELLETILDFNGYQRLSVDGGVLGVELARSESPDLVLMDIQMPDMDGYTAMKHIRDDNDTSHIPVVAVTGNATPADRDQMMEEGFNDIIIKPYLIDDVLNVVRRFVD